MESRSLIELAGLSSTSDEGLLALFRKALEELGAGRMSKTWKR
jgi:hypothetical protein